MAERGSDDNSLFFHASMKQRLAANGIHAVKMEAGATITDVLQIEGEVVCFYKLLLELLQSPFRLLILG